jgi:hypothetical protein
LRIGDVEPDFMRVAANATGLGSEPFVLEVIEARLFAVFYSYFRQTVKL